MSKLGLKYLLLVVVVVTIAGVSYFAGRSYVSEAESTNPDLVSYTSSTLGFSMQIPKKVAGVDRCEASKKQPKFSPMVKVIEDLDAKVAYVVPEYYYDQDEIELPSGEVKLTGECKKITYDRALIEKEKAELQQSRVETGLSSTYGPFLGWAVFIENGIDNRDGEGYTDFVKSHLGDRCVLSASPDQMWWSQDYYSTVTITNPKSTESEEGPGLCSWTSYYLSLTRDSNPISGDTSLIDMMMVGLGQEPTFWKDNTVSYDRAMLVSFKFTD